jgi:hypothetical protein
VWSQQPDYPVRFLVFQLAMFGLAFLMAAPSNYRAVRNFAFSLLIFGVLVTSFSVGLFYIPTVAMAAWVMVRRKPDSDRPV